MDERDVRIIFGNIEELARFSNDLCERLEQALGSTVPGGVGHDWVGKLFIEVVSSPRTIPQRPGD